jgi:hypothetical protein
MPVKNHEQPGTPVVLKPVASSVGIEQLERDGGLSD